MEPLPKKTKAKKPKEVKETALTPEQAKNNTEFLKPVEETETEIIVIKEEKSEKNPKPRIIAEICEFCGVHYTICPHYGSTE